MGDFVGELINGIITYYINAILIHPWLTLLFGILGMNGFAYDTMVGLGMYPELVVSHETAFNWMHSAVIAIWEGWEEQRVTDDAFAFRESVVKELVAGL